MPAVNQALAVGTVLHLQTVEMNARRISVQPGCGHMFCAFYRDAINMIDFFTGLKIFPSIGGSCAQVIPVAVQPVRRDGNRVDMVR